MVSLRLESKLRPAASVLHTAHDCLIPDSAASACLFNRAAALGEVMEKLRCEKDDLRS
jgi:hypothetical protein